MRAVSRLLASVGVALLATTPALAHHSFAAEFDGTKPVTLKGRSQRSNGSVRTAGFTSTSRAPTEKW